MGWETNHWSGISFAPITRNTSPRIGGCWSPDFEEEENDWGRKWHKRNLIKTRSRERTNETILVIDRSLYCFNSPHYSQVNIWTLRFSAFSRFRPREALMWIDVVPLRNAVWSLSKWKDRLFKHCPLEFRPDMRRILPRHLTTEAKDEIGTRDKVRHFFDWTRFQLCLTDSWASLCVNCWLLLTAMITLITKTAFLDSRLYP